MFPCVCCVWGCLSGVVACLLLLQPASTPDLTCTPGCCCCAADFGLSINFEQERPVTRVGTLDYM